MRALDIFALFRRLFIVGTIVFVGYFVLLANRDENKPKPEKKKVTINVNPDGENNTELEIIAPENPEEVANQTIVKLSGADAKEALATKLTQGNFAAREFKKVTVVHLHYPENQGSLELARSLEEIRSIHPKQVHVTTIDVAAKPEKIAEWRMASAPSLVIQTESERLYSITGVWPKDKLEAKILELIHGLQRSDKNWRPAVEGMERR